MKTNNDLKLIELQFNNCLKFFSLLLVTYQLNIGHNGLPNLNLNKRSLRSIKKLPTHRSKTDSWPMEDGKVQLCSLQVHRSNNVEFLNVAGGDTRALMMWHRSRVE